VGKSGRAAPGKIQGAARAGHVLDHSHSGYHAGMDRPPCDGHPVQCGEDSNQGYSTSGRGCGALLAGLGCGKGRSGSGRLPRSDCLGFADRPARDHRADEPGGYPGRAGEDGHGAAEDHRRPHHPLGHFSGERGDSRRNYSPGTGRRHVAAGAGRA